MADVISLRTRMLRRHALVTFALLILAAVVYLVGNNLFPLIDRDEPRFAQASKQMLESGDWTTPRFLDEPRLNKPILIYWLQATSMKIFGPTAAAARLPSSLAAVATLGLFALAWPSIVGHRRTFWALFIFATALMPAYLAKVCMADAVQHLFIAAAMLCLYQWWRGDRRWWILAAMGLSIGLAMLTKGPPVLMFLVTTLVALWLINTSISDRTTASTGRRRHGAAAENSRHRPVTFMQLTVVVAIAVAVCLPWAIALERARPGALRMMFSTEVIDRGLAPKEGHAGPPGFYFATFWLTYFPWCLFWPAALVHGWKRRALPWVRFSLAAVIGPWVFLEIYKTKLPHYWLPSFPFMALLTADVVLRGMRARIFDFRDRPFFLGAAVWAVAASLVAGLVLVVPIFGDATWIAMLVAGTLAFGIVALAWESVVLLRRKRLGAASTVMGTGMAALVLFVTCAYLPVVDAMTLAPRIASRLRDLNATTPGAVQMIGFKEPSLAFYQGGTIREQSVNLSLATTPFDSWPRWTVIDAASWDKSLVQRPGIAAQMIDRGTFTGAAYADGKRRVVVHILEKHALPTTMP